MSGAGSFDLQVFLTALDNARLDRGLSWRRLAREAGISASTLTRMKGGKRPDVDTFAALVVWLGGGADAFIKRGGGL